jgi:hypothetical protein
VICEHGLLPAEGAMIPLIGRDVGADPPQLWRQFAAFGLKR